MADELTLNEWWKCAALNTLYKNKHIRFISGLELIIASHFYYSISILA